VSGKQLADLKSQTAPAAGNCMCRNDLPATLTEHDEQTPADLDGSADSSKKNTWAFS
jgi:hypothetical protein